jgi:hypothetical protein
LVTGNALGGVHDPAEKHSVYFWPYSNSAELLRFAHKERLVKAQKQINKMGEYTRRSLFAQVDFEHPETIEDAEMRNMAMVMIDGGLSTRAVEILFDEVFDTPGNAVLRGGEMLKKVVKYHNGFTWQISAGGEMALQAFLAWATEQTAHGKLPLDTADYLSRDLRAIYSARICELQDLKDYSPDKVEKPPTWNADTDWRTWEEHVQRYLLIFKGKENAPLSYVIRDQEEPLAYHDAVSLRVHRSDIPIRGMVLNGRLYQQDNLRDLIADSRHLCREDFDSIHASQV